MKQGKRNQGQGQKNILRIPHMAALLRPAAVAAVATVVAAVAVAAILLQPGPGAGPGAAVVNAQAESRPAAVFVFNEQNINLLSGSAAGDTYTGLPTQTGLRQLTATYEDGAVRLEYKKSEKTPDPQMFLPVEDLPDFTLQDYPIIAISYRSTSSYETSEFYFATKEQQGLGQDKYLPFRLPRTDNWSLACVRASESENWRGVLSQLRFDVVAGEFQGAVHIRWVAFFRTEAQAKAFDAAGGPYADARIVPDKISYARGEAIHVSVSDWQEGDWVGLVQRGDACYMPSTHANDLYTGAAMPLLWAKVEDAGATLSLESSGPYQQRLLPAGEYDLIYCLNGRFVEAGRTTVTLRDEIAAEPQVTEKVYVTRDPNRTATPAPTPSGTQSGADAQTPFASASPSASAGEDGNRKNMLLWIVPVGAAAIAVVAAVTVAVARRRRRT